MSRNISYETLSDALLINHAKSRLADHSPPIPAECFEKCDRKVLEHILRQKDFVAQMSTTLASTKTMAKERLDAGEFTKEQHDAFVDKSEQDFNTNKASVELDLGPYFSVLRDGEKPLTSQQDLDDVYNTMAPGDMM